MAFPRQTLWQWHHQTANYDAKNELKNEKPKSVTKIGLVRPRTTSCATRSNKPFNKHRKLKIKKNDQTAPPTIPVDTVITNESKRREDYLFNAMRPLIDGAWRRKQYEFFSLVL